MRGRSKAIKSLMAIIFFAVLLQPLRMSAADIIFGFHCGVSSSLVEKKYDRWGWGGDYPAEGFSTPELKTAIDCSMVIFSKHFGFTLDLFLQQFTEVKHIIEAGVETTWSYPGDSFIYFGLGVEYRLFADTNRRFNPYVNAGLLFLFGPQFLNFLPLIESDKPHYPPDTALRISAGLRFKAFSSLFIDAKISYLSSSSILSFMAGLDFIF